MESKILKSLQKDVACSYEYKLVCVDDKFSKPFKSYLGQDVVFSFINSRITKKVLYWYDGKYFNKELMMTKEDDEDFENSTKYWICDNFLLWEWC